MHWIMYVYIDIIVVMEAANELVSMACEVASSQQSHHTDSN